MRKVFLSLAFLLALTGAVAAQSSVPLIGDIPFAFFVGDHQMPAGEYRFWRQADRGLTVVAPLGGSSLVYIVSIGADAKRKPEQKEQDLLVFNKYGEDRLFLSQMIHAGDTAASEMMKSKRERESVTSTVISGNRPVKVFILARMR